MAIEKVKKTAKVKRKQGEDVPPSPNIEAKRQEFKEYLSGEKPLPVDNTTGQLPAAKSNPKRRLAILIASIVAAIIISVLIIYTVFWARSPEKVVLDAVRNAAAAQSIEFNGTMYLQQSQKPQVAYNGAIRDNMGRLDAAIQTELQGDLSALQTSTVFGSGGIYLKINKLSQFISQGSPPQVKATFAPYLPIIKQDVDDKWMKVNSGYVGLYEPLTGVSQCVVDIMQKITSDRSGSLTKLLDIYMRNPLFTLVELSEPNDATGKYRLTPNQKHADAFLQALFSSSLHASLAGCSVEPGSVKGTNLQGISVDLAIDKASRQLTYVDVTTGQRSVSRVTVEPQFNTGASVQVPQKTSNLGDIQAKALQNDVNSILNRFK